MSRGIAEPHRIASHAAQSLAAENQAENKSDSERRKDRLGRILAHVLLSIFLQSAGPIPGISPHLLGFVAVFPSHRSRCGLPLICHHAGGGLQVLRGLARVRLAALEFVLSGRRNGAATSVVVLFSSAMIFSCRFLLGTLLRCVGFTERTGMITRLFRNETPLFHALIVFQSSSDSLFTNRGHFSRKMIRALVKS